MPSDEELMDLFMARRNLKGGKRDLAPTNRDLQLLKMRAQKQSYNDISEEMDMKPEEVRHQISLTLRRITRDLQIKLDVPELYKPREHSAQPAQVETPEIKEEKRLSILSERQREVWRLHMQGKSKSQIAKELEITYNAVSEHIRHVERKFREYDQYCSAQERNEESVFLPLTRGEVKIIIQALDVYENRLEHDVVQRKGSDWIGKLPVQSKIIADLYDKAQTAIYGKPLRRMLPDWDKDKK